MDVQMELVETNKTCCYTEAYNALREFRYKKCSFCQPALSSCFVFPPKALLGKVAPK